MPISYPLALPNAQSINSVSIRARPVVASTVSPFSLAQQIQVHPGETWELEAVLKNMQREKSEIWNAWRLKLNGIEGTFLMGDPNAAAPRGSAASVPGSPSVSGGGQTGRDLNIDGLPLSATGYLLAGDYVQLGSGSTARLYKVLDDVDSDVGGAAALLLWPNLRASPIDGAPVVVTGCVGQWRMAANTMEWEIDENGTYNASFNAVEAL